VVTSRCDWSPLWQVCTSVLRVARSAGAGLVPHLEGIAGAIGQMHTAGQLTPSEHGSLAEAILVIATAAG
jgi:exportin-5